MREQDPRDGESGPNFPVPPTPFKGVSQSVDAGACFEWLTQGWTMFIAHPGIWLGSSVLLLVCITAISLPPLFGQIALHLLLPVFGAGMLQISRSIAEGKEPQIAELFAGFRHQAGQLVMIGVVMAFPGIVMHYKAAPVDAAIVGIVDRVDLDPSFELTADGAAQ